jgi:hypothetical protein
VAALVGGVGLIGCGKQLSHPDAGTARKLEAIVAMSGSGVPAAPGTTGSTPSTDTPPPNDQQHQPFDKATPLGRWGKTSDRSARAIELERAYHKLQSVRPQEDSQFGHHLEILLVSLTHDGRFAEARAIEKEARAAGLKQWLPWFRLHLAERDWDGALKIAEEHRKADKKDKMTPSYLAALVYLKQRNADQALPELEVLQQALREHRQDKKLEYRLWEVQGLYMCQTGAADAGLKLLARAAERSKDDYGHHPWGNGAYFMETWGTAALQADRPAAAEEAFLGALVHDPGSVWAALGLQVLYEQQGRSDEAQRFADLAGRCWNRADPQKLQTELDALRAERYSAPR